MKKDVKWLEYMEERKEERAENEKHFKDKKKK